MSNEKNHIEIKIKKSDETFAAAVSLFEDGYYLSAVNRLYYASYYLISATLAVKNVFTKSHSGLRTQFSLHYIKTNIFNEKIGEIYAKIFEARSLGDYDDYISYEKSDVEVLIQDVEILILTIKNYLNENNLT